MADANRGLTELTEAAREQRDLARQAIEDVKQIEKQIQSAPDEATKKLLTETKERALQLAQKLTANSSATTAALEKTLSTVDQIVRTDKR
jgi:hypothetical protein